MTDAQRFSSYNDQQLNVIRQEIVNPSYLVSEDALEVIGRLLATLDLANQKIAELKDKYNHDYETWVDERTKLQRQVSELQKELNCSRKGIDV